MPSQRIPFPFRFAQAALPYEDRTGWRRLPSLKGISRLTQEELDGALGAGALGMTAIRTTGAVTNFGGTTDTAGGDTHYVLDAN